MLTLLLALGDFIFILLTIDGFCTSILTSFLDTKLLIFFVISLSSHPIAFIESFCWPCFLAWY